MVSLIFLFLCATFTHQTPNEACPGGGFGVGAGGAPGQPGEICYGLGNLLIIEENGSNRPPDDAVGGTIEFTFHQPVEMLMIDHMDNEGYEGYKIELTKTNGSVVTKFGNHNGNGGYAYTPLLGEDTKDVANLKVVLTGSGSVNSVKYRVCDSTTVVDKAAGGASGDVRVIEGRCNH